MMNKNGIPQTADLLSSVHQEANTLFSLPAPVAVVFDLNGKIYIANEAAAALFRKESSSALIGKNIFDLFRMEETPLESYVVQMTKSPREISFEENSGGKRFLCALSPALDKKHKIEFVMLAAQDVTDRQPSSTGRHILHPGTVTFPNFQPAPTAG